MAVIGYGFYGPVGPKGRTDRCTFDVHGTGFAVKSVSAGMKVVPVARLAGAVAVTPHGDEMARTWGAEHWTAIPRTIPAHLRKWAALEAKAGHAAKATLLEAMATFFEREIPAQG